MLYLNALFKVDAGNVLDFQGEFYLKTSWMQQC